MVVESQVRQVPIKSVAAAADNDREKVGDVVDLSQSIAEQGLLQPILVRPTGKDTFEVVAGARRLAAAELAGLDDIPVIVREFSEEQRLLAMAVENLQREDLTPIEEARSYQRLLDTLGCSQRDLAPKIGKNQSHISKRIALLALPKDVQKEVDAGGITIPDALELAKLAEHPERVQKVLKSDPWQSISVRVQHQLDELQRLKKVEKLQQEFESKGYATVLVTSEWQLPTGVHRLKGGTHYDPHALDITPKKHETEPCHAIAIPKNGQGAFPVCTNRKNHPKIKTEQEKPASERSRPTPRVDPKAKAIHAAREARVEFVAGLVTKKPTKDVLDFIIEATVAKLVDYFDGDAELDRVAIMLGLAEAPPDSGGILPDDVRADYLVLEFASRGAAEAQRALAALALADVDDYEVEDFVREGRARDRFTRGGRIENPIPRRYLEFLRAQGYELSDVEQKALDKAATAAPLADAA